MTVRSDAVVDNATLQAYMPLGYQGKNDSAPSLLHAIPFTSATGCCVPRVCDALSLKEQKKPQGRVVLKEQKKYVVANAFGSKGRVRTH